MNRLNQLASAALALAGMASTAAFATPVWGPSGEASYEDHQAQPVSQYTRAQVQSAYLQAAARGALPRTAEVVAESPAELVLAAAPLEAAMAASAPEQDSVPPVAYATPAQEQTLSYAAPSDAEVLASGLPGRAGDNGAPTPDLPATPPQASPDMIKNDQELALSEGEELVASDGASGASTVQ